MDPGAEFRGRVGSRRSALAAAAVPVLLAAVIGVNLLPTTSTDTDGLVFEPERTPVTPTAGPPTVSAAPVRTAAPGTAYTPIDPGPYEIPWTGGIMRVTVPAGWSTEANGVWCEDWWPGCMAPQGATTLSRFPIEDDTILTLSVEHDVEYLLRGSCRDGPRSGTTIDDLAGAILDWDSVGGLVDGGNVMIGGFPGLRFSIRMPDVFRGCQVVPGFGSIWANRSTRGFSIPLSASGTAYLVDVNGQRLVLTSLQSGASREAVASLEDIIASIEFLPVVEASPTPPTEFLPRGSLDAGRSTFTVAGIPMSIDVLAETVTEDGWASNGDFYIGKSILGPQGAEAAIVWTAFPDGGYPVPCFDVLDRESATSAAELAAAVARAPARPLALAGPTDVTVGGRPAKHVSFTIGNDDGCQPGFFFRWPNRYGGPLWGSLQRGDSIRVWIVDVDGTLLFIEALATPQATPKLNGEVERLIDSVQFE